MKDYENMEDLDFGSTEDLEDTYTHEEIEPPKPLVEDFGDKVNKNDLNTLQDMMVMMMKAGLVQANEKGIYPEKVIAQIQKTLQTNDVRVKTDEADKLKEMMNNFHNAGKKDSRHRKDTAMAASKVN